MQNWNLSSNFPVLTRPLAIVFLLGLSINCHAQGSVLKKEARGVVVLIGHTEAGDLIDFVKASPVVVLAVVGDTEAGEKLEMDCRAAGVIGQVSITVASDRGRIPLGDGIASVVVANRKAIPEAKVSDKELDRVLRPFGELYVNQTGGWKRSVKPRPEGMDDWAHFHHDARSSDHSLDTLVGEPRGLQWAAGPTNGQDFTLVYGETALSVFRDLDQMDKDAGLMARDAFSGLPQWFRGDVLPQTRFALVMGGDRVFLHSQIDRRMDPFAIALDRHSGETVQTFTEGLDFTVTDEELKADRRSIQNAAKRGEDLQFRLVDGLLVQCIREEVVVLDATTGKKMWSRKAGEGKGFVHPTAGDGTLYLVEGEYTRHSSYTHWPMARPDQIHAIDLKSGEPKWTFEWDENRFGKTHAIYNLQLEGDVIGGAVTVRPSDAKITKPQPHGLILHKADGSLVYWGREEGAWPGNTGAGHSHVRMHIRGDTAWTMEIGEPIAFWNIGKAADFTSFKAIYSGREARSESGLRPVSCTVWRSTPRWWFGGVNCYPIDGEGDGWFNRSGRSDCDIGSFPANGLLYSPPNTCQCQPYLPATKAYHSRQPIAEIEDSRRLIKGTGVRSPVAADAKIGWPQWRRDPERRGWSEETFPTDPVLLWQKQIVKGELPELLERQWEVDGVLRGPVTQAACSGGILVVAETQRHAIVGLDPTTGDERWRTTLDGRVDSQPSIHEGAVYAGTRNGWVYALARDTGEVIWKFFAAPADDRIAVNGQLESLWPVFGAVPVDEKGVLVIAGRHTACDGGLRWWQLDPRSGAVLADGRFGDESAWRKAANWPRKLPIQLRPMQNSVAVMSHDWFLLPGHNLRRAESGRLGTPSENGQLAETSFVEDLDFAAVQKGAKLIRFGRNALIGEKSQTVGGWRKPYYAHTLARIFSIRGDEFVCVGGGLGTASGRGGGGGSEVHRMKWLGGQVGEKERDIRWADQLWEHDGPLLESRGLPSVNALAVSENAVFLGASIYITGRKGEEEREKMAHRLRILDLESGVLIRDLPIPARVLQGGIALADGKIFVTTEDGSITAYGTP